MKLKLKKILSILLTVAMIIGAAIVGVPGLLSLGLKASAKSETLTITAKTSGETLDNKAGYMNTFLTGGIGNYSVDNPEAPFTGVVEYVELMNATGGGISALNSNAHDRDLIDIDGNFRESKLKELKDAINTILVVDAKPLIKLGSVPFYFTKTTNNPTYQVYGMNVNPYPPDATSTYTSKYYKENGSFVTKGNGFEAYELYLKDVIQYLINEYGIDEVRTWRWGVDTEYENWDWFHTNADDSLASNQRDAGSYGNANTITAYFKLYDYSTDAVVSMIGDEYTYIGAHAMAVSEGLWDETKFISQHLANSTGNYVTGGTVHCDYLAVSYYEGTVGNTNQNDFVGTIEKMRSVAKSYASSSTNTYVKNMLNNLRYGVDEGRILNGLKSGKYSAALTSRVMGQTWQAAYDARTYYQMINNDIDYFCSWSFTTGGFLKGMPNVSYHVAAKTAEMSGEHSYVAEISGGAGTTSIKTYTSDEVNAYATYNTDDSTMRVMAYNFKNDLSYSEKYNLSLRINLPSDFKNKSVYVQKYAIDDNANYFDEWEADLTANGISNNAFNWSPDSHSIENNFNYVSSGLDPDSQAAYNMLQNNLSKYKNAAKLTSTVEQMQVDANGQLILTDKDMQANSAVYYEICSELDTDGTAVIGNSSEASTVIFNVPECIYLTPSTATSGTVGFQYILDQSINTLTGKIVPNTGYKNISDGGKIEFYCPDAENVRLFYGYGSDSGGTAGSATVNVASGSVWSGSNGMYSATLSGGNASNITGYIEYKVAYTINGVSYTKIAYTYIYTPNTHALASTTQGSRNKSTKFRDTSWISGVQYVNSSKCSFGNTSVGSGCSESKGGYVLKTEPIFNINGVLNSGYETQYNHLTVSSGSYWVNTGSGRSSTTGTDSIIQSYLGIINFDPARVNTLNQIPNVKVGVDANYAENGYSTYSEFDGMYYYGDDGTAGGYSGYDNISAMSSRAGYTSLIKLQSSKSGENGTFTGTTSTSFTSGQALINSISEGNAYRWYLTPSNTVLSGTSYLCSYASGYSGAKSSSSSRFFACCYTEAQLNAVDKSVLRDKVQELIETVDYSRLKSANKSWEDENARFVQVYKTAAITLGRPTATSTDVITQVEKVNNFLTNYKNNAYKNDGNITVKMNMVNGHSDIDSKVVNFEFNVSKKFVIPGEYDEYTYESASFEYNLFDSKLFVDSLSNATYNSADGSFTASSTTSEKIAHGFWTKYLTPVVPGAKYVLTVSGSGSGSYIFYEGNYTVNSTTNFNGNSSVTITIPSNCYHIGYVFNSGTYNVKLLRVDNSGNTVMPDGTALPTTENGILRAFENKAVNAPVVNYTLTYNAVPHTLTVSANGGTINGESSIERTLYYNDTAAITTERPVRKGYSFVGYQMTGDEKVDYYAIYENGYTSIYRNFYSLDPTTEETTIIEDEDGVYTNYKMYGTGTSTCSYFNLDFPFNSVTGDTATITAEYRSRGSIPLNCTAAYNNYSGKTDVIYPDSSDEWKTISVSRNSDVPYANSTDIEHLVTGTMSALCLMFRQPVEGKTSTADDPFMDLDIRNVVITVTHADGTSETVPTSFKMPKNDVTFTAVWTPCASTVSYDNLIDFGRDFASLSNYADYDEKSITVNCDAITSSNKIQLTEGHSYALTYDVMNVGSQNNKSGCFVWYGDTSTSYTNTWGGDNKGYSLSPDETQHVEIPFTVTSASTTVRLRFDSHNGSTNIQNGKDLGNGTTASGYDLKYYNICILDLTAMGLAGKNTVPTYNGNDFSKKVTYGTAIGIAPVTPTLNNPGYVFDGWYTLSGTKITEATLSEFDSDTTLYSHWKAEVYSISYDLDGGRLEKENPAGYSVETASFTLDNPVKDGHTFTGWTGTGLSGVSKTVSVSKGSTGDRNYKANWSVNSYSVLFDANGGTCSTDSKNVTYNTAIGQLPTPADRTGFVFKGWYDKSENGNEITSDTILSKAENLTLFAHWEHDTFMPKADSEVVIEDKLLYCDGILSMTKEELAAQFSNTNLSVKMNTAKIATGTTLTLTDDENNVYDTLTVVVFGDTNCNGWYDGTDAVIVRCIEKGMLNQSNVSVAVLKAADCNHDGVIDSSDADLLDEAGVLLSQIDQTKSTEELASMSVYQEYVARIDQVPEAVAEEEPTAEKANFFDILMDLIIRIYNYLKLHFAIINP